MGKLILNGLIIVTCFGSAANAFAHGEDKPGPHGGFIRMPGAFHTEAVQLGKNQLKVYLLDINWKNPSVKDASVKVTHKGKKSSPAQCAVEKSYFLCKLPKGIDLKKKGSLVVDAQREGQKGTVVTYDLPLKLPAPVSNGHEGHH